MHTGDRGASQTPSRHHRDNANKSQTPRHEKPKGVETDQSQAALGVLLEGSMAI